MGLKGIEYYSGPCANDFDTHYVYIGHCYGVGDKAVPLHRIGVTLGAWSLGQPNFYLVRSDFLAMEHLRMVVEYRISKFGPP